MNRPTGGWSVRITGRKLSRNWAPTWSTPIPKITASIPRATSTSTPGRKDASFLDHTGIWEAGGVDSEAMFEGLHAIGYDGYVTVHQSFAGVMSIEESVRKSAEFLRPLMASR